MGITSLIKEIKDFYAEVRKNCGNKADAYNIGAMAIAKEFLNIAKKYEK